VLSLVKLAETRTDITLDTPIIQSVPVLGGMQTLGAQLVHVSKILRAHFIAKRGHKIRI
jgi:hypothetical protein